MSEEWIPIRYRDFWDVPRLFVVRKGDRTFLFDSRFDEGADEYSADYAVFELSRPPPEEGSWSELERVGRLLGRIPVAEVQSWEAIELPAFSASTIDGVVASSRATVGRTTEGARAIAKKLGHAESGGFSSAFTGLKPSQEAAEGAIQSIMQNPTRTHSARR